ncbi:hypothetical protein N657DRAFT_70735 [Parathielavia appendiculata]|uniref:Uncharacterized protein n=1 Tax=Parathielavia appendiculata TaxID=2587402 RepID=A0AAN6UAC7_9PEZI|nr:hypothetical protein N657DRAFT_70735 [Parathielavia appendiculata]
MCLSLATKTRFGIMIILDIARFLRRCGGVVGVLHLNIGLAIENCTGLRATVTVCLLRGWLHTSAVSTLLVITVLLSLYASSSLKTNITDPRHTNQVLPKPLVCTSKGPMISMPMTPRNKQRHATMQNPMPKANP